jgi:glycosyltransferase involved in cell wall biosynthesis
MDMEFSGDQVYGIIPKWNIRGIFNALGLLRRQKPQAVIIEYPTHGYKRHVSIAFLPWLIRLFMPKVKILITVHEFPSHSILQKLRGLFGFLMCHHLAIVAPYYRECILQWSPWLKKKITHIPVGSTITRQHVDLSHSEAMRTRHNISPGTPTVIYFGVLRPSKGIEFLMEAFCMFRVAYPTGRLFMIGHAAGSYIKETLIPLQKHLQIEDSITFTGRCTELEISSLFTLASMCVLPFPDGFTPRRTSFMAALDHEIPIITTTPIDQTPHLVDRENVLLVNYGDAKRMADQMIELQSNNDLQRKLRSNTGILKKHYAWADIAGQILNTLQDEAAKGT